MLLTSLRGLMGIFGKRRYHRCLYISSFVCCSCISKKYRQKKKKKKLWDEQSGLCMRLPGPSDILQLWCTAALPGRSEPSIFINHSTLLLCPPRTNTGGHTERRHTSTHTSVPALWLPFSCGAPGLPGVYVTECTWTRFSWNQTQNVPCFFFFRRGTWNGLSCGGAPHPAWHRLDQEMI